MAFTLHNLGENIKRLRERKSSRIKEGRSMLQYELAEIANIPPSSLCNIEKGKYGNPTWVILSKIAMGLECDISDFFQADSFAVDPAKVAINEMIDMIIKERLDILLEERLKKTNRHP